jgi:hypothetical protein
MDFRVRAISTTADIHIRTLKAKEREFKAFLDVLIKAYPHIILLLRQQREGKRTIPTDRSTGDPLRALHDGSGGECHDEGDNLDDRDNDNGHNAGLVSIEVAKVPALVCAISQRLSAARGDIQRYVTEVQHEEEKYRELGSRLFCATSDGSDVILVNALFGLIPLLLDRVDSSNIVEGEDRHESGIVSGKGRRTYVFPATTTWPPTVPPTTLDTDICESSLGFRSSILPFWNEGRWQVAVFQSAETRVLIDPWGLDDSRGLHVRKTSWDAF